MVRRFLAVSLLPADSAKFTIPERDQTDALFNNTWATPNELHTPVIAGLSSPDTFQSYIAWDWPNPPTTGMPVHGYHTVYHGLDPGAGMCRDTRFPFQISQHSALKLHIPNVTVKGQGGWGSRSTFSSSSRNLSRRPTCRRNRTFY